MSARITISASGAAPAARVWDLLASPAAWPTWAPHMYREVIDVLEDLGFAPIWFTSGFRHHRTGRLLQMDGIFARTATTRS